MYNPEAWDKEVAEFEEVRQAEFEAEAREAEMYILRDGMTEEEAFQLVMA